MTSSQDSNQDVWKSKRDAERWMRWLLVFCHRDFRKLPKMERVNLKKDLFDLCQSSSCFDLAELWRGTRISAYPEADLQLQKGAVPGLRTTRDIVTIQRILKEGLTQLYPDKLPNDLNDAFRIWEIPASIPKLSVTRFSLLAKQRLRKKSFPTNSAFHPRLSFYTKWPDLFWFTVAEIIEECGPRLRRCEECKSLFLREKRQAYCSQACSQKVRSRKWYMKHGEEIKKKRRQASLERIRGSAETV